MNEMVERVARVIYDEQWNIPANAEKPPFEDMPPHKAQCWKLARAAIAAMREPTEAMENSIRGFGEDDLELWHLMIDAALAE